MVQRLAGPLRTQTRFDGAALFADIAGYTELTETLVAQGEGLDHLSGLLDRAFGHYVGLVENHGGEVLTFAGDALLAYWPVEQAVTHGEASRRAMECAEQLHASEVPIAGPLRPRLHIGIECAGVWGARVGGEEYTHLVFGGAAVREAIQIGAAAMPGESATSSRARTLAIGARDEPGMAAPVSVAPERAPLSSTSGVQKRIVVPGEERDAWSAELRHTTSLFVRVDDFD